MYRRTLLEGIGKISVYGLIEYLTNLDITKAIADTIEAMDTQLNGDSNTDTLLTTARNSLQEKYKNTDANATRLSSLLHLYLAKLLPCDTEGIEKIFQERTKIITKGKSGEYVYLETKSDTRLDEAHPGQLLKLLNLLVDDKIISEHIVVGKVGKKSYHLNDFALGSARGMSISDDLKSTLDLSAWNIINIRTLPPEKEISYNFGRDRGRLQTILNDIYNELCLYENQSVPSRLSSSKVEYLSHGVIGYCAYLLKNSPETSTTAEQISRLYSILIKNLEETITAEPFNTHRLGHYLEAIGRIINSFSEYNYISLTDYKESLSGAVYNVAKELVSPTRKLRYAEILNEIEIKTHALIGAEMVNGYS